MEQQLHVLSSIGDFRSRQEAVHRRQTRGKLTQRQVAPSRADLTSNRLLGHRHHRRVQPQLLSLRSCREYVRRVHASGVVLSTSTAEDLSSKPSSSSAMGVPSQAAKELQDVVIVGGGIAGLATALALHRLGVTPVLLEQSERLRTAGSSIGIWSNAWKALEALGVADNLRNRFMKISGLEIIGQEGNVIKCLNLKTEAIDVELRGVERKALLETLREPLPDSSVFYDSQVVRIKKLDGGYTEVQCVDGQTFQTKVLIGCDGAGSVVAKYMNVGEPKYAGYVATRGLAVYPDGHNFRSKATQIIGRGVRAGLVPMDANRVYWFVVFNSTAGERLTDVELVREEAINYVKEWPLMIREAIDRSESETLSRRAISDRWMWPVGGSPLYQGGVTLAGDAMHPMTPNLGQGGCCALEDAVILARALSKALITRSPPQNGSSDTGLQEMQRIELALKSYTQERWPRVLRIAIRSYVTGALLQLDNKLICTVRNNLIQKLITLDQFVSHTYYDCGTL